MIKAPQDRRDPRIESFLTKQGVEWAFRANVAIGFFDLDASIANQARPGEKLDAAFKERYAISYLQGDPMPPFIGHDVGNRVVLNDGVHRLAACYDADVDAHDVYIIASRDPSVQDRITRLANIYLDGKGLDLRTALMHAKHLVASGYSQKDAAEVCRVSEGTLAGAIAADRGRLYAEESGIVSPSFTESHYKHFSRIRSRPVRIEAMQLAADAQLLVPELERMSSDLNRADSEEAQHTVLGEWRERVQERRAQVGQRTVTQRKVYLPVVRLFRLQEDYLRVLEQYQTVEALGLTAPESAERWRRNREKIADLEAKLTDGKENALRSHWTNRVSTLSVG